MVRAQQHLRSGLYGLCLLMVVALATLVTIPTSVNEAAAQASAPPTPTGLAAPAVSHDAATLNWDDPGDASITGYQALRRSRDGDDYGDRPGSREFVAISDGTGSSGTTYTHTSVSSQTRHTHQVKAHGTHGVSEPSGSVDGETTGVPASPPVAEQQAEQTCPAPTAVEVPVTAVPIVVESTTADYFVLYASHDVDGTTVEYPVRVVLGEDGTTTLSENVAPLPKDRYRVEKYSIAEPADVDGDCIDDITELGNMGAMNPLNPTGVVDTREGAMAIPDQETFDALAFRRSSTSRPTVKFVLLDMDSGRPKLYFMNTRKYKAHGHFLNALGIDRARVNYHGSLFHLPTFQAPDGSNVSYFFQLTLNWNPGFSRVERSYTLVAAHVPLVDDNLAMFVRRGAEPTFEADLPLYDPSRMTLVFTENVLGEADFMALNRSEGYGMLRSLEPDERPHSRDVVIYETLPNELPRVAGIITTVRQTPLSHVNLRALQDKVPNAFIADALEDDAITDLIDSYVYYAVTRTGYTIRAATQARLYA